jgi:CheY-like chemotaxis protein
MRSLHANLEVWPFGDGQSADEPRHEAEGVGLGDAFDSFGPISEIRRALSRPLTPPQRSHGPHDDQTSILVAERDPYQRRLLRVLLASQRVSQIEVEDGQSAVDLLALRSFDLLLLGLDLPCMSGEETISWVRRSLTPWADIPILGLVDERELPMVGRLQAIGMTDWTMKPFSRRDLIDKLIKLMPGLYDAGL